MLLEAITEPIQLDTTDSGRPPRSRSAPPIGAAYSITPVGSGTELLRQASVALDQARAANITFDFYDPAQDELGGPAAVVMTSELHAALDDDQLDLHYQPIIHLPSGAPLGDGSAVALAPPHEGHAVRRASSYRCSNAPLTTPLRGVAARPCPANARQAWGERNLPVSINLAARCLLDRRFPEQVEDALDRAGVPGHQLMFEIDETAVADPARAWSATSSSSSGCSA